MSDRSVFRFTLIEAFVIAAILGILSAAGVLIYHEIKHPCVEWKTVIGTCGGGMTCNYTDPETQMCMSWTNDPTYLCELQQCIRRKP